MAKITPFEMRQVIAHYVHHERVRTIVHHPELGYVPSAVRETLERINLTKPPENAQCYIKAVKQCLSEKGVPFEETFRMLHAIFFLLDRGYTLEMAKKKARLLSRSPEYKVFLSNFVKPEHVEILKAA